MPATIRELGRPGDLGWVVAAHGEQYAEEFGWNASFEVLVARLVADYAQGADATRERAWIAELDGARVGCIFCCAEDEQTARLRMFLTLPAARGQGLGRRLVRTCLDFARSVGYRRMVLWTTDPLLAARAVYLDTGFQLVDEAPESGFGPPMTSQTYALDL